MIKLSFFTNFFKKPQAVVELDVAVTVSKKTRAKSVNKIYKSDQVKAHLLQYGEISSWEAIQLFKATRLSSIIHCLRHRDGMQIDSERKSRIDSNGNNCNFVTYRLVQ